VATTETFTHYLLHTIILLAILSTTMNKLEKLLLPKAIRIHNKEFLVITSLHPQRSSTARIKGQKLALRLSSYLSQRDLQKTAENLLATMEQKLGKLSADSYLSHFSFKDASVLKTALKPFHLEVTYSKRSRVRIVIDNESIALFLPKDPPPDDQVLMKMLRKKLAVYFKTALEYLVSELNRVHFRSKIKEVKIKELLSRWGSCSNSKVICLSSRLLFVEYSLLEYVIIHELAHLTHMNHSAAFWRLVAKACPEYKTRQQKLKRFIV